MDSGQAEKVLLKVVQRMSCINNKLREMQIIELCDDVSKKVVSDLHWHSKKILEAVEEIKAVQGDRG